MKKSGFKYFVLLPLVLSVTFFLALSPAEMFHIDSLTVTQQRTIAIFAFAALMWIFEIVPNWVTSLIVILVCLLTISDRAPLNMMTPAPGGGFLQGKAVDDKILFSAFSDPVVILFLGGFVLAIVASKYGIDKTLARILLKPFGKNPRHVLLGVLFVISLFSMFMSNTATAAMFLTFLAPVFAALPDEDRKGKTGLVLAIPVAANIGGIGTPIGTPPNATAVGVLDNNGISITFGEWAIRFIPYVAVMILIAWVVLSFLFPFKSDKVVIKISRNEKKTGWRGIVVWATFIITILLWMTEQWNHLNANIVALIPLVVFTATGIFTIEDIKKINWSVLWLVAGGFALGYALNDTGLAEAMVSSINFSAMNVVLVFVVAGAICYLLSNFISNSATAALMIPIMVAIGRGLLSSDKAEAFTAFGGQQALAAFVAVCASLAMLLPISTPPNAIAASTGLVKTSDMARVGIILGVAGFGLAFLWLTEIFPF